MFYLLPLIIGRSNEVYVYVSVYGPSITPVRFEQQSYAGELKEDAGVNTKVLKVKATGQSGISYKIVGGNIENAFKISLSGEITVAKAVLDRERIPEYKLAIRAIKTGISPELAMDVICTITVKDVNDNSPRFAFTQIPKAVAVDSYSPVGTKVLQVRKSFS